MSREIKFRAWDKKQKKMFYGVSTGTIKVWDENAPLLSHEFGYSKDCIFEQYTGLKDKNSKEIYEGDIVYDIYTGDEVFIVGWDKDKASFMLADTADYPMAYFDEYELDKDLEVIGNIHENKELWSESV